MMVEKENNWVSELGGDDIDIEVSIMIRDCICSTGNWKTVYTNPIKSRTCKYGKHHYYRLEAFIYCEICGKIQMDFRDDPKVKEASVDDSRGSLKVNVNGY